MDIKKYESMLLTARNKFIILPKILEEYKKEVKEECIKAVILESKFMPVVSDDFDDGINYMCEEACEAIEKL